MHGFKRKSKQPPNYDLLFGHMKYAAYRMGRFYGRGEALKALSLLYDRLHDPSHPDTQTVIEQHKEEIL